MNIKEFPSIVELMEKGIQKEISHEVEVWNTRTWKGTEHDRFPLSPSQIGKCALALARNLSHYINAADYPRDEGHITPRVQRIFSRGHLLESALIDDIEKYTDLKVIDRQKRITLFRLSDGTEIKGDIDGIAVSPAGRRVLLDFKSKGAFYSANFTDSINQFFSELKATGYVEEIAPNAYYINDPKALFDSISLDEFFVDYLLQLNAYGSAEQVDFVSLYYENKNTCANYEVRWVPNKELFQYAKDKFEYIYRTVKEAGAEAIAKEFALGSARCRLCDYNEMCWGKYTPGSRGKLSAPLPKELEDAYITATRVNMQRTEEDILMFMQKDDLTHVTLSNGVVYERKFLKSPKPHYELRLSK